MLSKNLERTLRKALSIATEHKHEYATYEHLLLAIMGDRDVRLVLVDRLSCITDIENKLKTYLKNNLVDLVDKNIKDSMPTAGFQRIIQRSAMHNQTNGQLPLTAVHVLAEFFFEHDSYALLCLKEFNLNRKDVLDYAKRLDDIHKTLYPQNTPPHRALIANVAKDKNASPKQVKSDDAKESDLEKYCVNLNEQAGSNSIDLLIGRENEIQRTIEILCRRKKNNAILVGEPGVGKTAIAEGLAVKIVNKDVPDILKDTVIYSLDIGSLVAGTKFRGDFEERIKSILNTLKANKNIVLFIDEIHTIIGAGSTTSGAMDASNLLKPALAKGDLRCIGSITFKEYHNHFEKDMALVRRFQKIVVEAPSEEESFNILQGVKGYYEKHHNVTYTDEALKAAVHLSERYINDRHLPDKAIDLIDEAGARSSMAHDPEDGTIITEKDIEVLLSAILNIPNLTIEADEIKQLKHLSSDLKRRIFGQDEAIESLCGSIKLGVAGLRKGTRPTGCYLFTGPTGVGKTELAKQLSNCRNMKLLKFDMSEFVESSSISKLVGSSPGYVGFDQGGLLTAEVDKYPYSVILFDEIEKAHPDIFNLLLQVMDEGTLTDNTGKHINFTHSMIILTSNLIAGDTKAPIGFSNKPAGQEEKKEPNMENINEHFSPEFRSRLDKIIIFNPIDGIVEKIVSKNLKELASMLADKKVRLTISKSVIKYFVENCFSNASGARGLDRMIDTKIKQKIADEILFGKLKQGGTAILDFSKKDKEITFKFSKVKKTTKNEQCETS
ncbi:MAG: ATP-dependent Clp protease ATP-binding subunit ClpA [Rickettsiales bacterium]|nr:MAG: ATP-dependent Clp protease ATP-binding subunit ClpA [Rickettsiales bacterium]